MLRFSKVEVVEEPLDSVEVVASSEALVPPLSFTSSRFSAAFSVLS